MKKNKQLSSKLFKTALAASMAAGAVVVTAPMVSQAAPTSFKDLPSTSDHYQNVLNLASRGAIHGFEDGTFKPNASVTRGQAAKIIATALNLDTKNVKNPGFKDVSTKHAYYGPIAALVQEGIITGFTEDNTYRPGETLTRAQMAKIISLAFDLPEETEITHKFTDVKTHHWYKGYVQTLVNFEITKGTTATTFEPGSPVRRGQLASFVIRAENAVKSQGEEVISISNNSITLPSGTYTLTADLQNLFNAANASALEGAKVKFTAKDGQITAIQSLEISKNNATIDAGDAVIAGNVIVSANGVTLKNATVNGELKLGNEISTSFKGEKLAVKGKTTISSKKAIFASTNAVAATNATITFQDSTLGEVIAEQSGNTLSFTGTGTVGSIYVAANITIEGSATVKIEKITVPATVNAVTVNANVETLTITNTATKITLGANASITNLVIPADVKVEDVITNYDQVKDKIDNIDGTPVVTPPPGGGIIIPPPTDPTPQEKLNSLILQQLASANLGNDPRIAIKPPVNNTFNVEIKDQTSTLDSFATSTEANSVFNAFKSVATVDSVNITFLGKTENIIIKNNDISLSDAVDKAINRINQFLQEKDLKNISVSRDSKLSILVGESIDFQVTGTIDNRPITTTYTFTFKVPEN